MVWPFLKAACAGYAAALLLHAPIVSCKAQSSTHVRHARPTPLGQGADQSLELGEWTTEVASRSVVATDARLVGDSGRTRFLLTVSRAVRASAFPVANPPRVIIDLPDVEFRLDPVAGQRPHGLVTAYRYGLLAPGKSRIVLDTAGPVHVEKAQIRPGLSGERAELAVELVKADTGNVEAATQPSSVDESLPTTMRLNAKPVIMIDPGHGGLDPGAVGAGGLLEKNLVMAVSRHLRAILAASGQYRVVMTRNSDMFVSLDQRLRLSRRYGADLFVSIHADAVGAQNVAPNVRGATVYTLSEQASDEQARRLAEKENAADVLAGRVAAPNEDRGDVRNILIDLLRQETANLSADFQTILIGELRTRISLAREPQRSAAFKVLKQTHSPAVLIELGYMSNAEDQKLMKSVGWQTQVARTIATAIDAFFAKRLERTRQ